MKEAYVKDNARLHKENEAFRKKEIKKDPKKQSRNTTVSNTQSSFSRT